MPKMFHQNRAVIPSIPGLVVESAGFPGLILSFFWITQQFELYTGAEKLYNIGGILSSFPDSPEFPEDSAALRMDSKNQDKGAERL